MRILIVSTTYPPYLSGVAVLTANLATTLSKRHQVTVISTSGTKENKTLRPNKNLSLRLLPGIRLVKNKNITLTSPQTKRVEKIIDSFKPDVIHLHDPSPLALSALIIAKNKLIPIVATHHFTAELVIKWIIPSNRFSHQIAKNPTTKQTIYRLVNIFYNRCDLVTIPNPALIPYFNNAGLKKPIITIPNGIDVKRFSKVKNKPSQLNHLNLKKSFIILFVGRLDVDKNIDTLITAFEGVHQQNSNCHLVLVGEGNKEKKLRKQTRRAKLTDSIHFLGTINNTDNSLSAIYKSATIFANPSIIENQSVSFIEAMSTGLPIVAADTNIQTSYLKHMFNGLLFQPNNPPSLAAAIQKLISDKKLRRKISKNNLRVSKNYDISITSRKYLKAYKSLLD